MFFSYLNFGFALFVQTWIFWHLW